MVIRNGTPTSSGALDDRIRQPLGPQIEAQVRGRLLHHLENVAPEAFLLAVLQARLVVHAELDGIQRRHLLHELGQRRLGVRDEILAVTPQTSPGTGFCVASSAPGMPPPCTPPR